MERPGARPGPRGGLRLSPLWGEAGGCGSGRSACSGRPGGAREAWGGLEGAGPLEGGCSWLCPRQETGGSAAVSTHTLPHVRSCGLGLWSLPPPREARDRVGRTGTQDEALTAGLGPLCSCVSHVTRRPASRVGRPKAWHLPLSTPRGPGATGGQGGDLAQDSGAQGHADPGWAGPGVLKVGGQLLPNRGDSKCGTRAACEAPVGLGSRDSRGLVTKRGTLGVGACALGETSESGPRPLRLSAGAWRGVSCRWGPEPAVVVGPPSPAGAPAGQVRGAEGGGRRPALKPPP